MLVQLTKNLNSLNFRMSKLLSKPLKRLEEVPRELSCFPLGTVFAGNRTIRRFLEDAKYFTGMTGLSSNAFEYSSIEYARFPFVTSCGTNGGANYCIFGSCASICGVMFDKITFIGGSYNYNARSEMYTVITTQSVPSTSGRWFYAKFYVLDNLVDLYKADSGWSRVINNIKPLSQLPTDYPDCPWLDDLREKGLLT